MSKPTEAFVHRIEANGRLRLEGRFVCVCVEASSQASAPAPISIDPRLRAAAI